jgi:hypothetical protein
VTIPHSVPQPLPSEILGRAIYEAGALIPGRSVPTTAWRDLPASAKRQWIECGEYLVHALRRAGAFDIGERAP